MPNISEINNAAAFSLNSANGRNDNDKLKAKSHFFIEGVDFNQSSLQKFGPVSEDIFRTTASIDVVGTKKIFTICQGTVFIQPQVGSNKVNLILKPFNQPISGIPIKYFVYRGLKKSDFISGDEVAPKTNTSSGFINYIWDEYEKFYNVSDGGVAPTFLSKFIGYPDNNTSQSPSDLLNNYFYKITTYTEGDNPEEIGTTSYELPLVPRGVLLGTVSDSIGIDIVLDKGDYTLINDNNPFKLDLTFARSEYNIINVTGVTNPFQRKLIKESVMEFMDITAFYGLHANNSSALYVDELNSPLTNKVDIYSRLTGFLTKNAIYIYIKSNRQRSYNFYEDYFVSDTNINNIKIGDTVNSIQETLYGTLNWPIHVFNDDQNNTEEENKLFLRLLKKETSSGVMLFNKTGDLITENKDGFIVDSQLLDSLDVNYSIPVEFSYPNIDNGGVKKNISSIIEIVYNGVDSNYSFMEDTPVGYKRIHNVINHLFGPINARPLFVNSEYDNSYVNFEPRYLNLNNFSASLSYSITETRTIFKLGSKYVNPEDENSEILYKETVLFVAKKNHSLDLIEENNQETVFSSRASRITKTNEKIREELYFKNIFGDINYFIKYYEINEDTTDNVRILSLENRIGAGNSSVVLGITKGELDVLNSLITSNMYNIDFYFYEDIENQNIDSLNNFNYFKYSLGIIYENETGEISTALPLLPIYIYSLNLTFFTSKEYADFEFFAINGYKGDSLN